MKNKIIEIASFIIGLILYIMLTTAIILSSKIVYGFILVCAIVLLCFFWKEKMNILKLWALFMIIYSMLVLCGINSTEIAEKYSDNLLILAFLVVAELFAVNSGKIVIIFLVVGVVLFKPAMTFLLKALKHAFLNKKYGPLPNTQWIVKGNKKIYFHKDYDSHCAQLIYRNGSKKRILDTYEMHGFPDDQFSMELEKEEIIVRKYNLEKHASIMEKRIKLPRN